jgi:ABC-2 type transport system permease protein
MISFRMLSGFVRKEFSQAFRDPKMKIILFVMPLIQLTIFGVAISTNVQNIRLWAQPEPNDTVLRHIYEHSIESKWFLPVHADRNADPFTLLSGGKIDAALIPPPGGLTKSLIRGTPELQLLVDATNVIKGESVYGYIKKISDSVVLEDLKESPQVLPIAFIVRVLYNPTLETTFFMVPGVMCILLCVITITLTSMSITREKEMGTFEMLISAPVSRSDVIFGKTIPYIILGMCDAPLVLAFAVFGFGVPMRGSFIVLMLVTLTFVCSTVAIGTLISTFANNQQQSILAGFLFLFPAILLSGVMFPIENMPDYLKWLSYLDPLSHYLFLLRNILLKGGELTFIFKHTAVLGLIAVVVIYLSFKRFQTTLR